MNNHNLEQLHTLKSITLSESERGRIRAHAAHLIQTTQPQVTESFFHRGIYMGLRIALSSFVFFIFIGGTVSAVADNALPGDPLYSFKLNVNEEIKGLFQKTPAEKVAYGAQRVENRVKEIKTLAESKTLTKAKQATVQKALDAHIKDLSTDLTNLSDVAPTAALTATTNLEEALKANKEVLVQSGTTTDTTAAVSAVDDTIKEVSNQEVKILTKEIDNITTEINTTTPTLEPTSLDKPSPTDTPVVP
jgi:hypothetical protein